MRKLYQTWVISWCNILDGVVGVLTLGLLRLSVSYHVVIYFALKNAKQKQEQDTR